MIVAGWADGYRNNSFRTVAELARHGTPAPAARRPVGARRPGDRDARAADRLRRRDGGVVRPLAARRPGRHQDRCDVFVRTSTRPEIDLDLHEGWWVTTPSVPPVTEATLDLDRPGVARRGAGRRHRGLDRLRRPPPVGTVRRPAARRRALADLGDRAAARTGRRPPGVPGHGSGPPSRPASLSVKLCDVFADGTSALVTRGTLDLAYRDGVHGDAVAAGAGPGVRGGDRPRRLRLRVDTGPDVARVGRRRRLAEHDRAPGPVSITLRTASLTLPLLDEVDFRRPGLRGRGRALLGVDRGCRLVDPPRRAAPDDHGHDAVRQPLPHAVRRDRARALPRRGLGRHAHLRPERQRPHRLRPDLARHRGHRALGDDPHRHAGRRTTCRSG